MDKVRVAIIGGGPAGLSLAKFLQGEMHLDVTVLERDNRVGGRCLSETFNGHVVEYGTCYAIRAHRHVLQWMKELGIATRRIRQQTMDERQLMDFVTEGSGPHMALQVPKYLRQRSRLLKRLDQRAPGALDEAAMPILDWLTRYDLGKVERLMYRVVTTLGYGFLNEVSTLQALRWVDFDMFATGFLKLTYMPVSGWQDFWNRLAVQLPVRTGCEVTHISRIPGKPAAITLASGETLEADIVVCAVPLDVFGQLAQASEDEAQIEAGIKWGGYALSLMSAAKWFEDDEIRTWSDTAGTSSRYGRVFVARRECPAPDFGGTLYAIGQRVGPYSSEELQELLIAETQTRGAQQPRVIKQKVWRYFPEYDRDAIVNGLPYRMIDMQGAQNTYYTGASFSHEAVSNICNFNANIAQVIARHRGRPGQGPG